MIELLEALLSPEMKLKLRLRKMSNDEIIETYLNNELKFRLRNKEDFNEHKRVLYEFRDYLHGIPPTQELAKGYLSKYINRKPRTIARYAKMIRGYFNYIKEPFEFKINIPKSEPRYTEDSEILNLHFAIENKKTHKKLNIRDSLMIDCAQKAGMRVSELENLEAKEVHTDFLIIINGKGQKDRVIPLPTSLAGRLHEFIKGMKPNEKVFKLKRRYISMKIKQLARKAGLPEDFHAHNLRGKYITTLIERGGDVRTVQELAGHNDLNTTQKYAAVSSKRLKDVVKLLDSEPAQIEPQRLIKGETLESASNLHRYRDLIEEFYDSLTNINAKVWPVWELLEAPWQDLRSESTASLMELKSRYIQGKLKVKFIIEDRDSERYSTFLRELAETFPEFKSFALFKKALTVFIGHCQEVCGEIWQRVEKETGLKMKSPFIVEIGASLGRIYDIPKFTYEFCLDHYQTDQVPQLQIIPSNLGYQKYELVPEKDPQRALAVGTEGGDEADALKRFLVSMHERLGEGVYNFNALHFGVHPQAIVEPHQCPNVLYRRLIEHCHSSNIHVHIGAPESTKDYPYWAHITGDIRTATFQIGDTLIHDRGHLTTLEHPAVRAIAAKYPGRPGLSAET